MIELKAHFFEGHTIQVFENDRIIFGFSELNFSAASLQRFFKPRPLLFLRQIHSARIVAGRDWLPGMEGDGFILDRPGYVAVIQTADCLPLFFFSSDGRSGGVLHVGWRGLWQGIEKKLLAMLGADHHEYFFYLGPAIEKKCYIVGEDLPRLFANNPHADKIFTPLGNDKFLMDLKTGLLLSLRASGIADRQIHDSGLCTYCSQNRFPSYRRDGKTGKRVYNFLTLQPHSGKH